MNNAESGRFNGRRINEIQITTGIKQYLLPLITDPDYLITAETTLKALSSTSFIKDLASLVTLGPQL
jgi:hypothetical protein